ncbi:hypothetical protein [Mycobacterium sp. PS03-16]|uniref:hypothetical protein n=1 Tax=Mycobacterium sp. PS03-16 TaxID=2559611 RepID=UPI001ADDA7CB|nr:hypothetical protein [Mycobacterium sp. PS03-16]
MTAEDWPRVEAILAAGIAGGEATFETATPSWEQFDAGWVAASRVSGREVWRERHLSGANGQHPRSET